MSAALSRKQSHTDSGYAVAHHHSTATCLAGMTRAQAAEIVAAYHHMAMALAAVSGSPHAACPDLDAVDFAIRFLLEADADVLETGSAFYHPADLAWSRIAAIETPADDVDERLMDALLAACRDELCASLVKRPPALQAD